MDIMVLLKDLNVDTNHYFKHNMFFPIIKIFRK